MNAINITKDVLRAVDGLVVNVDLYRSSKGYKKLENKDALHLLEVRAHLRKARESAIAFIHSQS